MSEQPTNPHQRVLPFDVDHPFDGNLGGLVRADRPPAPPSYEELDTQGLIAPVDDPDHWFSPEEVATASWLRDRDCPVRSVRRREGQHHKTPDAVAMHVAVTIETKTADSSGNAISQRIREGRKQARRVVLDLRGTEATIKEAQAGIDLALGRYGQQLDEIVLILADDTAVGWAHG